MTHGEFIDAGWTVSASGVEVYEKECTYRKDETVKTKIVNVEGRIYIYIKDRKRGYSTVFIGVIEDIDQFKTILKLVELA